MWAPEIYFIVFRARTNSEKGSYLPPMNLDLDLETLLHEGQLNFCEAKPPYHSKICQVYQSSNLQPHFIPFKCAKLPHINLNEVRTTAFNGFEKLESFFNLFWIVRVL